MEFNYYKPVTEGKAQIVFRAKDKNNPEIKKVYKTLSNLLVSDLKIIITNDENIVNIDLEDKLTPPITHGTFSAGSTRDDLKNTQRKLKDATKRVKNILNKSRINIEDMWDDGYRSVGLVLGDY